MNTIDKSAILKSMKERLTILENRNDRDFSGGVQTELGQIRELKVWIGQIERGEHDIKVWE
jgi:hypothetical protein